MKSSRCSTPKIYHLRLPAEIYHLAQDVSISFGTILVTSRSKRLYTPKLEQLHMLLSSSDPALCYSVCTFFHFLENYLFAKLYCFY